MTPTQLADRYFASVRARDIDGFIALFAEDAIFVRPDGGEISGAPAIREMELSVFTESTPLPSPVTVVAGESAIAAEVHVRVPDGTVHHMASFFRLNGEGLIHRLSIYRQGGRRT